MSKNSIPFRSRALAGASITSVMMGAALVSLSACVPEEETNTVSNQVPDYVICNDHVQDCGDTANVIVE